MTDIKRDVKDETDGLDRTNFDATITTTPVLDQGTVDPVYQAKAHVLNNAVQQIGMGKYQWELVSFTFSNQVCLLSTLSSSRTASRMKVSRSLC